MMRLMLMLMTLLLAPTVALGDLLFEDGFETGTINLDWWNPQVYDVVGGATIVSRASGEPVRSGEYALRMKLAVTDPTDPAGKHRTELRPRSHPAELAHRAVYGVPYVYTFSLFVPEDWQPDAPEILAQWHGKPDQDELGEDIEPLRSPPLALRMTYIEDPPLSGTGVPAWNIVSHWDDNPQTASDKSSVRLVTLLAPTDASADLGTWTDWRFEVTWDWQVGGEGQVRVLKNGVEWVDYSGPNAFHDEKGPNSKIGIYKWNWPTPDVDLRIAYYDDVRIERAPPAIPSIGPAAAFLLAALVLAFGAYRATRA